jgi:hypothetical protein
VSGVVARHRAGWVCVVAMTTAVLAGCAQNGVEPSPTPSISLPSPSPIPSVTVDANGRALPGFVTASQELPPAQTLPTGLLAATGPGWSLQTYRPQVEPVSTIDGVVGGFAASVQVVYLVAPGGQRYQLLELDPATPIVIDSWTAGESVAYVRQCDPLACDPSTPTQQLDLTTGTLSPVDGVVEGMHIGATLAGSVRWWQGDASSALDVDGVVTPYDRAWLAASASGDGDYLAVTRSDTFSPFTSAGLGIVDVASGTVTDVATLWTGPLTCSPFRWRVDDALDAVCEDPEVEAPGVYTVGPGAQEMVANRAATATPPGDGPWVEPDFLVSQTVWAGPYTASGADRLVPGDEAVGLARNAGFEELTVPDATVGSARVVSVVNGVIYIEATQRLNPSLATAWAYDVASGAWNELAALPPAGPTRGLVASQGSPASGMTSWVVAP